jgi:hypothetical protein
MPYSLTLTSGTPIPTDGTGLPDAGFDTVSTSITLIGKNVSNYGQDLNNNMLRMMEHFASSSQPNKPLAGQIWWDTRARQVKVYTGTTWKIPPVVAVANSSPPTVDTSAAGGDLWWDTSVLPGGQLKVFTGSAWTAVGPFPGGSTASTGSCFTATAFDPLGGTHQVTLITIGGPDALAKIMMIISNDTFTVRNIRNSENGVNYQGSALAGFNLIVPGVNYAVGTGSSITAESMLANRITANTAVSVSYTHLRAHETG